MNISGQVACRKNGWPLDRSTTASHVTEFNKLDDIEKKPHTVSCECDMSESRHLREGQTVRFYSSLGCFDEHFFVIIKLSGLLCAWTLVGGSLMGCQKIIATTIFAKCFDWTITDIGDNTNRIPSGFFARKSKFLVKVIIEFQVESLVYTIIITHYH